MITRKAITAAFEVITNDPTVKTVTVFVYRDRLFSRVERVRITRVYKNRQEFRVMFGRCNYAEREFLKKPMRNGGNMPKLMILDWPKKRSVNGTKGKTRQR